MMFGSNTRLVSSKDYIAPPDTLSLATAQPKTSSFVWRWTEKTPKAPDHHHHHHQHHQQQKRTHQPQHQVAAVRGVASMFAGSTIVVHRPQSADLPARSLSPPASRKKCPSVIQLKSLIQRGDGIFRHAQTLCDELEYPDMWRGLSDDTTSNSPDTAADTDTDMSTGKSLSEHQLSAETDDDPAHVLCVWVDNVDAEDGVPRHRILDAFRRHGILCVTHRLFFDLIQFEAQSRARDRKQGAMTSGFGYRGSFPQRVRQYIYSARTSGLSHTNCWTTKTVPLRLAAIGLPLAVKNNKATNASNHDQSQTTPVLTSRVGKGQSRGRSRQSTIDDWGIPEQRHNRGLNAYDSDSSADADDEESEEEEEFDFSKPARQQFETDSAASSDEKTQKGTTSSQDSTNSIKRNDRQKVNHPTTPQPVRDLSASQPEDDVSSGSTVKGQLLFAAKHLTSPPPRKSEFFKTKNMRHQRQSSISSTNSTSTDDGGEELMSLAQPTTHSNNSSASSTVSAPLRATTVTTTTATATTVDNDAAPDTKKTWSCPKCTFDNALSPEQVLRNSVVELFSQLDE